MTTLTSTAPRPFSVRLTSRKAASAPPRSAVARAIPREKDFVRFMPTLVAVGNVGEDIVDEDVVCGLDVEAADGVRGVDAHRFVRAVGAASEARL